jgi:anti-sigma B factor antagonist
MTEIASARPAVPLFEVDVRHVGRRAVIDVAGEIDIATAGALESTIREAIADGVFELWIDLGDTEFIDSTGMRLLIDAQRSLSALQRRLAIVCPDGAVRRAFAVARLDRVLPLYHDRAAAQVST